MYTGPACAHWVRIRVHRIKSTAHGHIPMTLYNTSHIYVWFRRAHGDASKIWMRYWIYKLRGFSYRQISYIRCSWKSNQLVNPSHVVGASHVGAAPTTFSFSTAGLYGLGKYSCKTRRETFTFWELMSKIRYFKVDNVVYCNLPIQVLVLLKVMLNYHNDDHDILDHGHR